MDQINQWFAERMSEHIPNSVVNVTVMAQWTRSIRQVRWKNWASNGEASCVLDANNHSLTEIIVRNPLPWLGQDFSLSIFVYISVFLALATQG